ncbi:MAG: hypothetical protein PVJ38_08185 [Candidatus Bathyarchaeota archaeon]|jgi:hypothetical protein
MTWFILRAALGRHIQTLEFNSFGELWIEIGIWLVGAPQVFWWFNRLRRGY